MTADFNRFLSLVIVDYGTGIRVAAPTSVLASMTHAARAGIIIKSGGIWSVLPRSTPLCSTRPARSPTAPPGSSTSSATRKTSRRPSARSRGGGGDPAAASGGRGAARQGASELGANIPPCDETKFRVGLGVEGQVNGYYLHVGNERFMRRARSMSATRKRDRAALDEQGYSCLYVAVDGKLAGLVPYTDQIRAESRDVIARLHAMGIRNTVMLTGDNGVVARAVCTRIGLSRQFADMLPADKADVIQQLQREGKRRRHGRRRHQRFTGSELCRCRHRHEARRRSHRMSPPMSS